MEKQSIEVIVGKPVEGPVDQSKLGKGLAVAPKTEGEVGGRYWQWEYVRCPNDGAINLIQVDSERWHYYTCFNDGYIFAA